MATVNGTHNLSPAQMENAIDLSTTGDATTTSQTTKREGHLGERSGGGLPYKLNQHRKNWIIWFSCFCFDGCVLPIVLFYSLWYGSSLSHWTIFAIITALSFWTAYHKWFTRGYRLLFKRDPKFRPINGHRWAFDCSYYILSIALLIIVIELVVATAPKNVKVRVIAMAPPSVLYVIAIYMLVQNSAHCLGMRAPVTLSSVKRGSRTPPPIVTVMEDVFAADGCHLGLEARQAVMDLYHGNESFRRTTMWWSWIWGIACLAIAIGLSVVVGVVSATTAFGITYGVSFPFIALLSIITAAYMERQDARGVFSNTGVNKGFQGRKSADGVAA